MSQDCIASEPALPQNVDPRVDTVPSTGLEAYLSGQTFAISVNCNFVKADRHVSLREFRDLSSLSGPVMVNLEKCSSVGIQLAVSHYGKFKLTAPYASAVFRITKPQLSCKRHLFQDMQLLSYQQGSTDSCVCFFDPPAVSGMDDHMSGEVAGAPAHFLSDSGSAINAISEAFCKRYGIACEPCPSDLSIVTVGGGPDQQPLGQCKVKFKLQAYHGNEAFLVLPLEGGYDILLGKPWLTAYDVDLKHQPTGLHAVKLRKGTRHLNLHCEPQRQAASACIQISAVQFGRRCRKRLPCFTVLVSNQDNTASDTIVNVVEDGRMEPSRLQRLLDKHKSVLNLLKGCLLIGG